MATYSNTKKFIDAYGADGVISRSELNKYTGSNWEKLLNQAAKGKFRLGSKAETYVNDQLTAALFEPGMDSPITGPVAPDQALTYNNLDVEEQFSTLSPYAPGYTPTNETSPFDLSEAGPLINDTNTNNIQVPYAPDYTPTNEPSPFDLSEAGPLVNTGYFGDYSGSYGMGPINPDALSSYSSSYESSSDTGSQSSTTLGPNTSSGDMVQGGLTTYDLSDPSDIAYMQTYEPDFYRNLVAQGQIPGVDITDLPPLEEEEEEEVYEAPTGGVDLTGGAYQPGSDSGGTGSGGSVDSGGSGGSASTGSGGSSGGQGGGDVTDVETPSEPYVPTDADRYFSSQRGLEHDAGLGGFNPIAYLAAYSDIADLAKDFTQEGASEIGGEEDYLGAINARQGTNFSDFSQMDPTDAYLQVAREHVERFGFDEGRLSKEEGSQYGTQLAEFDTGSLDNFITELRGGKLKASTSAAT